MLRRPASGAVAPGGDREPGPVLRRAGELARGPSPAPSRWPVAGGPGALDPAPAGSRSAAGRSAVHGWAASCGFRTDQPGSTPAGAIVDGLPDGPDPAAVAPAAAGPVALAGARNVTDAGLHHAEPALGRGDDALRRSQAVHLEPQLLVLGLLRLRLGVQTVELELVLGQHDVHPDADEQHGNHESRRRPRPPGAPGGGVGRRRTPRVRPPGDAGPAWPPGAAGGGRDHGGARYQPVPDPVRPTGGHSRQPLHRPQPGTLRPRVGRDLIARRFAGAAGQQFDGRLPPRTHTAARAGRYNRRSPRPGNAP